MKVLVLATTFPRWKDDATASFVLELCKGLAGQGHEMIVLAPHHEGAVLVEEVHGIRIYRFPYFWPRKYQRLCYGGGILPNLRRNRLMFVQVPFLFLSQLFHAIQLMRRERVDTIHSHWIVPCGIVGSVCHALFKCRFIITLHGSGDIFSARKVYFRPVMKWVLGTSDVCTVNSYATARAIQEIEGLNHNMLVIPMGVELGFPRLETVSSTSVDISPVHVTESPVILSVCRLIDWKGVGYLVHAMALLKDRFPQAMLIICGDGPEREKLEKLAKDLGLTENISFEGYVPHDKLTDYYRSASVFVLPSILIKNTGETEGLGVVLLEAMSYGVPVIGSDVGGIPEVIEDGENGFLCRPEDSHDIAAKIEKLLTDDSLRRKFAQNGALIVKDRFSWTAVVEKFEAVYERLGQEL